MKFDEFFGLIIILVLIGGVVKCTTGKSPVDSVSDYLDDRSYKKERCAERADSASTSYAAKKIYKACMSR